MLALYRKLLYLVNPAERRESGLILPGRGAMDAVRTMGPAGAIVPIAHRLTKVSHISRIFMPERDRLVAQGTCSELPESRHEFRAMAAGTV